MIETRSLTQPLLITGGTGFAGSHLIEALIEKGYHSIHTTTLSGNRPAWLPREVTLHQVDLTNRIATLDLLATVQPTQVYHLASFAVVGKSFEVADTLLQNNIALQLNILEGIRTHAPSAKVLSIGSAEEYGAVHLAEHERITENYPLNPVNPYAVSKTTQELLSHAYQQSFHLPIVRVRPFNHIGERQTEHFALASFAKQIAAIEKNHQTELQVGNLSAVRDFTDVKDMVRAYILAMEKGEVGEVYNIGSGVGVMLSDALQQLCNLATIPIRVTHNSDLIRPLDVPRVVADNGKIAALGWQPSIPLVQTLERLLDYWRHQA